MYNKTNLNQANIDDQSEAELRILARSIARTLTPQERKIVSGGKCDFRSNGKATERGDQNDYASLVC